MKTAAARVLSRIAALAILLVIMTMPWVLIIEPIWAAFASDEDRIEAAHRQIAGFRQVIARRSALERQLSGLSVSVSERAGLLEGNNLAVIAAQLQGTIKGVVEANRGQVRSLLILPNVEEGEFQKISIRIEILVPADSLLRIVHALEARTPFLFLENLGLHAASAVRTDQTADVEAVVTARWDVSGYVRLGQAS